jgi:O-antigen/teichoic acid export membrane protein
VNEAPQGVTGAATPPPVPTEPAGGARAAELLQAIRNGLKLGGSLAGTWVIALGVRLWLPRALGPESFGRLTFAETLTAACFVVLALGLDTYIRKEIPVRPEHASDFFATFLGLRVAVFALLTAVLSLGLAAAHQSAEVRALVLAFAIAQLLQSIDNSLSALLHARGTVGALSVVNVAGKLLWGAGVTAVLLTRSSIVLVPVAVAIAESVKVVALFVLARRHVALRLRWDLPAARAVIGASLPFYLALVAQTVFSNVDVTILSAFASSREVGWFGGAESIANIALFATPLLNWVLMPLMARAHARSTEELHATSRRGLRWLITVTTPVSLALGLGAAFWLQVAFGPAYVEAATALRVLAPMFVLTYVASLLGTQLILLDRAWVVTWTSIAGVVVDPLLNALLVPRTLGWLGTGGGGVGCAVAHLVCETATALLLLGFVGRAGLDRPLLSRIARTLATCGVVLVIDRLLPWPPLGRLVADALAYVAIAWGLGALTPADVQPFLRAASRRAPAAIAA